MDTKDLLRQARIENGLTMKDVAEYVGVSEATVCRWESGEIENMKRNYIYKLSVILHLSPMQIMGFDATGSPAISPAKQKLIDSLDGMTDEQIKKLLVVIETAKAIL